MLVGGQPLALPLGTATVTWLGHWELQVGTATAALGVCPPPPTLSIIIFLGFPSIICLLFHYTLLGASLRLGPEGDAPWRDSDPSPLAFSRTAVSARSASGVPAVLSLRLHGV